MTDETHNDDTDDSLPTWSRWLIGLGGGAITTFGTLAVFTKDTNVAGVPLLIVAGAGFLYVALTGQRLIQVNKDGVVFSRERQLRKTLDEVTIDPDIPETAKERILEVAEANGVLLSERTPQEFENVIGDALRSISKEYGLHLTETPLAGDRGYDFLVTGKDGKVAAIEVKMRLRTRGFAGVLRQLRGLEFPSRILVVDGPFPAEMSEPFHAEGIWVVGWGDTGRADLIESIRASGLI